MNRRRVHEVLLTAVLAANFLGLTLQWRTRLGEQVRNGLVAAFAGGQNLFVGAIRHGGEWFESFWDADAVRADRARLAARVARLEWDLTVQRGLLVRARGFTPLDRASFELGEPVAGEIVGVSASPLDRTVTVNRGTLHGVAPDAPVMAASGLVGRVVSVGPNASQVELLLGATSAVASLTSEGRARGIVRASRDGAGDAPPLRLDYVPVGREVRVGESVISSGLDRLFPKGLLVGAVAEVTRGSGMLLDIGVEPAVDFAALERVFLLPPLAPESGRGP